MNNVTRAQIAAGIEQPANLSPVAREVTVLFLKIGLVTNTRTARRAPASRSDRPIYR